VTLVGVMGLSALLASHQPVAGRDHSEIPDERYDFLLVTDGPCVAPKPASKDAAPECSRMAASRRYRGTWPVDPEGSFFTPRGRQNCVASDTEPCIALAGNSLPWPSRWACPREFDIEFIGRRNAEPNFYNGPRYKIVVDKLILMKPLPGPPYDPDECDAAAP